MIVECLWDKPQKGFSRGYSSKNNLPLQRVVQNGSADKSKLVFVWMVKIYQLYYQWKYSYDVI